MKKKNGLNFSQAIGIKVPKGKKAVLVDCRTWLVVDQSRSDKEVVENWQDRIDGQDNNRRMKRRVS